VATWPALVKTPMSEAEYLALGETNDDEYYDGMCVVNPTDHQRAELALARILEPLVPPRHELLVQWGWRTGGSWFRPDLMIVPAEGPADIAVDPPLLIVEILSPSNRLDDLIIKRSKYADGRLPWYWIVDLDEASLTVLQLIDGLFVEVQRLSERGTTVGPVRADVDPASLA
jgi:Uma2 family endonuclease